VDYHTITIERLQAIAAGGDAEGQFALGVRYAHGEGVQQDYATAVLWLRQAAEQDHAGAQDSLGVRYATGQGVPQSDAEAVRWFRRAAQRGHAVAQFNLGLAFVHGQGVPQDAQQAYVWFALSAEQGDVISAESRDRVAETLDWEQLQQAKISYHQKHRQIQRRNHDRRIHHAALAEHA